MNLKKNVKFFNVQQAKQIYHFEITKEMLYKQKRQCVCAFVGLICNNSLLSFVSLCYSDKFVAGSLVT
jgi:hypothetical protein